MDFVNGFFEKKKRRKKTNFVLVFSEATEIISKIQTFKYD